MSLFSVLFPDADPPATVENASVVPEPLTPAEAEEERIVADELFLDHEQLTRMLRNGSDRLATARAKAEAGSAPIVPSH